MKITIKSLSIIIIIAVFGGIGFASFTGYWQTESSKIPQRLANIDAYDPGDIRGSYTFDDVSKAFDIPIDDLKQAFLIPDEYEIALFKNKDLESLYAIEDENIEIGNGSVKMFVAIYKSLPYEYETNGDYIPLSAYNILSNKGLLPDDASYIKTHLVDLSSISIKNDIAEVHDEETIKINRYVTFKELIDQDIPLEQIEKVLAEPVDDTNVAIKDYCDQKGISFGEIKGDLEELLY